MDIQVAKFREVLGLLKPVVPRKTSLPILTNVLLKDGQAMATDLETMVIISVPEADAPCLVPYADVVKMLQYTQGGESLHIEVKDGKLCMSWSEGSSSFDAKDVQDFPDVPKFEPVAEATLNSDALIPTMVSVLPYVASGDDRPVLSGVTLVMGDPIEVAAGDGFRMAYQVIPLAFPQNITLMVPASSVRALYHLWEKTPRNPPPSDCLIPVIMAKKQVSVAFDGKAGLRFIFGTTATAIVKLIQGSPPAWVKLIPKEEPLFQSQVMVNDLMLAVRRAQRVAGEDSKILRMEFEGSMAKISAQGEGQTVESSIKTFATKESPNKVGLDVNYLLEYLNGKEGIVTIAFSSEGAPVVFHNQKTPAVIIMPMKVGW